MARRQHHSTLTVSRARAGLYRLVDETAASHRPVVITGRRANAVLISEEDWRAIQETLYLLSLPGMRQSIRKGLATPIQACVRELDWRPGNSSTPSRLRKMRKS